MDLDPVLVHQHLKLPRNVLPMLTSGEIVTKLSIKALYDPLYLLSVLSTGTDFKTQNFYEILKDIF